MIPVFSPLHSASSPSRRKSHCRPATFVKGSSKSQGKSKIQLQNFSSILSQILKDPPVESVPSTRNLCHELSTLEISPTWLSLSSKDREASLTDLRDPGPGSGLGLVSDPGLAPANPYSRPSSLPLSYLRKRLKDPKDLKQLLPHFSIS